MKIPQKLKSELIYILESPKKYGDKKYPDSIMFYGDVCNHDSGFMCQCRIDKLKEILENWEE